MIVVSDTSPLAALLTIGQIGLLEALYRSVVIPPAVAEELRRRHPMLPGFIQEVPLRDRADVSRLEIELDLGEAEAIALAKELKADALLIDELVGRKIAQREGVPFVGLLGVLVQAKKHGLIQTVGPVLTQLEKQAGFFISAGLRAEILARAGEVYLP